MAVMKQKTVELFTDHYTDINSNIKKQNHGYQSKQKQQKTTCVQHKRKKKNERSIIYGYFNGHYDHSSNDVRICCSASF
jgi:hypothetical protein